MSQPLVPKEIEESIAHFKLLPGVGEKSAMRNILYLLSLGQETIEDFSQSLFKLSRIKKCISCGVFLDLPSSECSICSSDIRKGTSSICVVENYNDFLAIERSEHFNGLYHCLGGVLNPLLGIGPRDLDIDKLVRRVKELEVKSVILAINPSLEGQATCSYLNEVLSPYCVIERIGFGMPIGGSLEFLDPQTISTAMANKKVMD